MTLLALARDVSGRAAADLLAMDFLAMAGREHVSSFTRKFVAGAVVVTFLGILIFVWWLKSDREDD